MRSSSMLLTLLSDYSHLLISSCRAIVFVILSMHIFSTISFQLYSPCSLKMPISLRINNYSSIILPRYSSRLTFFSFSASFNLVPCSKTNVIIGRTSMSGLETILVWIVLDD